MSRSRHHKKWFFFTFSNFHLWSHFCHVPSWGDIGIPRSLVRPRVRPSVPPSVPLFTTFSGFCALADESLGRNGIKFGMLMYPDDLLSADINADGYFVISCVCPPVQLSVRLGFSTAYKSPGQKVYILGMLVYPGDLPQFIDIYGYHCPSVHSFAKFSGFCAFADKSFERNGIKYGMLIYLDDLP